MLLDCVKLVLLGVLGEARLRRDVPVGQCFSCEVTCFEDCANKFEKEIIKPEEGDLMEKSAALVQKTGSPRSNIMPTTHGMVAQFTDRLRTEGRKGSCDKRHGCKVARDCAKTFESTLAARQAEKEELEAEKKLTDSHNVFDNEKMYSDKGWTRVAAQKVSIVDLPSMDDYARMHGRSERPHGNPTEEHDEDALDRAHSSRGSASLIALDPGPSKKSYFPVRPVKINVFSKGYLTVTKCIEYCLTVTCGCEGTPYDLAKSKAEYKKGAPTHIDTMPTWNYKKATLEQCGNGHEKIISGLWIDYGIGIGGQLEVCSKEMFEAKAGADAMLGMADISAPIEKCKDLLEHDWGCSWNPETLQCEFKAWHSTVCYHRAKIDEGGEEWSHRSRMH